MLATRPRTWVRYAISCGLPDRSAASTARSSASSVEAGSRWASIIATSDSTRPRRPQSPRSVAMARASSATGRQSSGETAREAGVRAKEPDVECVHDGGRIARLPGRGEGFLAERDAPRRGRPSRRGPGTGEGAGDEARSRPGRRYRLGLGQGPHPVHRLRARGRTPRTPSCGTPSSGSARRRSRGPPRVWSRTPSRAPSGGCRSRHPDAPARPAMSGPSSPGPASSASRRKTARWRSRSATVSPLAASWSAAYWRIVSSIR